MLEAFSEISGLNPGGSVIVFGIFHHSFKRNLKDIKERIKGSSW